MKLSDILFESSEQKVDEFARILEIEVENVGRVLLYRGMPRNLNIDYFERYETVEQRPPRDTNVNINNYIDRIGTNDYSDEYISRKRNVVFTTLSLKTAKEYGLAYIIFVPKQYRAVKINQDPTESYFNGISSTLAQLNYLIHKDEKRTRKLEKFIYDIYGSDKVTYENAFNLLNNINSIEDIDLMLNDVLSVTSKKNINHYVKCFIDLKKITKLYFNKLEYVEAPWDNIKTYEIMINCPWYYAVDVAFFKTNFIYDKVSNKYVRK